LVPIFCSTEGTSTFSVSQEGRRCIYYRWLHWIKGLSIGGYGKWMDMSRGDGKATQPPWQIKCVRTYEYKARGEDVIVSGLSDKISRSKPTRALNSIYSIRVLYWIVDIMRHILHEPSRHKWDISYSAQSRKARTLRDIKVWNNVGVMIFAFYSHRLCPGMNSAPLLLRTSLFLAYVPYLKKIQYVHKWLPWFQLAIVF
jgi:hypothetical protein